LPVTGFFRGKQDDGSVLIRLNPKNSALLLEEGLMALEVGQIAPDFCLDSHTGQSVRLSEYRGRRNVVVAFFPLAWTPV
jgi:AhpC/TSA family